VRNKAFTAALLAAVLLLTLAGTLTVELVNANFVPGDPPIGTLILPENKAYTKNSVPITVRWSMANNDYRVQVAGVALLNGRSAKTLVSDGVPRTEVIDKDLYTYYYYFDSVLTEVPDGIHTLKVTVTCSFYGKYDENWNAISYERYLGSWKIVSESVSFTVFTGACEDLVEPVVFPNVTVFSPQPLNASSDVIVRFMVDQPVESVSYSLDGKDRVNVDAGGLAEYSYGSRALWRGNLTLTDLTAGNHSLTVYAKDTVGNTGNATVTFTIEAEQEPQPFPTIPVATSIAVPTVIGIGVGLLVHFKKRKH